MGPFTVPAGQETAKLKVKVRMNLHGLVSVESVQSLEEENVEDTPMTDANNAAATAAGDAPADAEQQAPQSQPSSDGGGETGM